MTGSPPFASTGLHSLDIVARRYGTHPGAILGLDARADAAAAGGDWETSERWRREAWRIDEACALVGLHAESPARQSPAEAPAPKDATMSAHRGTIKGVAIYRPQDCPPWLDAILVEGKATLLPPGDIPA